jgi:hypothetical protein
MRFTKSELGWQHGFGLQELLRVGILRVIFHGWFERI